MEDIPTDIATAREEVDKTHNSSYARLKSWCRSIGVTKFDDLFLPSITHTECSVCSEAMHEGHPVVVHLCLLKLEDKPRVHGSGATEREARDNACAKAIELLETFEPEIFTLRRKRLRVRLEDLGVTLPKTENMLLLESEKAAGMDGLPQPFLDLVASLCAPERDDDEEDVTSFTVDKALVENLSSKLLFAIPNMKTEHVESIFNKIGLSLCDEMNAGMNPIMFGVLISLILRLPLASLTSDEKLKLSFSKVMEQVVILNAENYPGYPRVVARVIRYLAVNRALPFMSRNRLESIGVQWSVGGISAMKIADVEYLSKTNESTLKAIVADKTPPKEYLDSLFSEFAKINVVIRELFGVDGSIYGSLVNGFPTSSSDIDVVINLETDSGETETEIDPDEDEDEDSSVSKKCLAELNRLHDAIRQTYGDEFSVSKIESARVPILIVKKGEKIEINISFNHEVVIHNSALLRAYSSFSPRVRELVVLVKHWAKKREINDALQGSLSSYSYVLLVVAFLQQSGLLPDLQNPPVSVFPTRPLPERITDNGRCSTWFLDDPEILNNLIASYSKKIEKKSLTTLLIEFFEFYLYDVNFVTDLVSVSGSVRHPSRGILERTPWNRFVKKLEYFKHPDVRGLRKRAWLAIVDPFEIGRILGTSARGMETITKEMKRGIELLLDGNAAELFDEYSRKERTQLPPFPARKLDRKDFFEYVHPVGLRKEFKTEDVESVNRLISSLSASDKAGSDIRTFGILCYMSRIGLPTEVHLKSLGLIGEDGKLALKLLQLNHQTPKISTEAPKSISSVRNELLSHHPDARFHQTVELKGKGKGKGTHREFVDHQSGSGKGKGQSNSQYYANKPDTYSYQSNKHEVTHHSGKGRGKGSYRQEEEFHSNGGKGRGMTGANPQNKEFRGKGTDRDVRSKAPQLVGRQIGTL